tara:strand:- start:394 stop:750 length:357 start_codon:yes stop_codon:yes gene_type:complete
VVIVAVAIKPAVPLTVSPTNPVATRDAVAESDTTPSFLTVPTDDNAAVAVIELARNLLTLAAVVTVAVAVIELATNRLTLAVEVTVAVAIKPAAPVTVPPPDASAARDAVAESEEENA